MLFVQVSFKYYLALLFLANPSAFSIISFYERILLSLFCSSISLSSFIVLLFASLLIRIFNFWNLFTWLTFLFFYSKTKLTFSHWFKNKTNHFFFFSEDSKFKIFKFLDAHLFFYYIFFTWNKIAYKSAISPFILWRIESLRKPSRLPQFL